MTSRRAAWILAALLLASACTDPPPSERPPGTVRARNATATDLLPTFADELPAMDPPTFHRLLDQLRGTPVVLNFWGSWCPPCREEMPRLVEAHEEWGDRVQFLGVDILDERAAARDFMEEYGMTFPSVFDVDDAIKTDLGQFGQPTTVFFRADGSFAFAWAGPISDRLLRRHLEAIAS